jgi:hypothetical protein
LRLPCQLTIAILSAVGRSKCSNFAMAYFSSQL